MRSAMVARAAATQVKQKTSGQMMTESRPVNALERERWSGRFGHDFSRVRIFEGPESSSLAGRFGARGLAVEPDVVLGEHSDEETLGHELAHVAQAGKGLPVDRERAEAEAKQGLSSLESSAPAGEAQFEDEEKRPPTAASGMPTPVPDTTAAPLPSAQETGPANETIPYPPLTLTLPQANKLGLVGGEPSIFDHRYDLKPPAPLFTPGAGPALPRAGGAGDVLKALMAIPTLGNAADAAGSKTTGDLRQAWQGSDWWGRSAMLAGGAGLLGGLALPLAMPQSRQAAATTAPYSFIQNTNIPLGPASFRFNLAGRDQNFGLMLDLAKLFPVLR